MHCVKTRGKPSWLGRFRSVESRVESARKEKQRLELACSRQGRGYDGKKGRKERPRRKSGVWGTLRSTRGHDVSCPYDEKTRSLNGKRSGAVAGVGPGIEFEIVEVGIFWAEPDDHFFADGQF